MSLQLSLLEEAKRVAKSKGVALNQSINVAVADKLSALRADEFFRERPARAEVEIAKRLLQKTGRGNKPVAGDKLD